MIVTYELHHADGGRLGPHTFQEFVIPGKGRPLDKSLAAALTYVQGYALRGLLNIPRTDTADDVDQRDDTAHKPRTAWTWPEDLRKAAAAYFGLVNSEPREHYREVFARALGRPWNDYEGANPGEAGKLIAWLDENRERLAGDDIDF